MIIKNLLYNNKTIHGKWKAFVCFGSFASQEECVCSKLLVWGFPFTVVRLMDRNFDSVSCYPHGAKGQRFCDKSWHNYFSTFWFNPKVLAFSSPWSEISIAGIASCCPDVVGRGKSQNFTEYLLRWKADIFRHCEVARHYNDILPCYC